MSKQRTITIKDIAIQVKTIQDEDYISLTDMVKNYGDDATLYNWMRNRNTVEFIGIWEQLHNPNFKGIEFERFKMEAGLNAFTLTPKKWIEATDAIGFMSKAGRYGGGTFAHRDIAFEFGSWLSAEFKLLLIKEFQRLKADEAKLLNAEWNAGRLLSKLNYHLHTDAIREHISPKFNLPTSKEGILYAAEADLLNMAVFGISAKAWREQNPDKKGNIRDNASLHELTVLANLESYNSILINYAMEKEERFIELCQQARHQLSILNNIKLDVKRLS